MEDKLKSIGDIASFINSSSRLDEILELITRGLCRHSIWSMSGILAVDEAAGVTRMVVRYDPYLLDDNTAVTEWAVDVSPSLKVAATGKPLIISNVQEQSEFPTYQSDAQLRGYRTAVILPLKMRDSEGRPLVLTAHARDDVAVEEDELIFLETVAGLAAIAIARAGQIEHENRARTRLEQIVGIHSSLMQRALSDDDLAGIFAELSPLFSFPAFVYDTISAAMITSKDSLLEADGSFVLSPAIEQDLTKRIGKLVHEGQIGGEPITLQLRDCDDDDDPSALIMGLEVDGEVAGVLGLLSEPDRIDEIDLVLIQMAKLVLGVVLLRKRLQITTELDTRTSIYEQLFAQDWRNADLLKARAMRTGIDLDEPARLILIRSNTVKAQAGGRGQPSAMHHNYQLIDRVADTHLERYGILHIDDDFLVVLPGGDDVEDHWQKVKGNFLSALSWSLGAAPVVVVSRLCGALEDYSREWKSCERIARLAATFALEGYVTERDLGSSSLLLSIADNAIVQDYLSNHILPIVHHDEKHGTDYLNSLRAFVESEGGYKACASALGIHVTTLRYRIERINELFGIDATDQQARFDLQLAVRLLSMKGLNRPMA